MEYGRDYWGFVYLWRDAKSGMYCVGSHYGRVDDGYVSSTGNMRQAYRKRPQDFTRRIIYWLRDQDRSELLAQEDRFLSCIEQGELSTVENHQLGTVRYFNCKKFASGGAWNKGRTGVQVYPNRRCEHCDRFFSAGMHAAWHGEKCLKNPGITIADRASRSRRKRVRQPSHVADNVNRLAHIQCSVCGVVTSKGNIVRWHEKNCQPRRARSDVICRTATNIS